MFDNWIFHFSKYIFRVDYHLSDINGISNTEESYITSVLLFQGCCSLLEGPQPQSKPCSRARQSRLRLLWARVSLVSFIFYLSICSTYWIIGCVLLMVDRRGCYLEVEMISCPWEWQGRTRFIIQHTRGTFKVDRFRQKIKQSGLRWYVMWWGDDLWEQKCERGAVVRKKKTRKTKGEEFGCGEGHVGGRSEGTCEVFYQSVWRIQKIRLAVCCLCPLVDVQCLFSRSYFSFQVDWSCHRYVQEGNRTATQLPRCLLQSGKRPKRKGTCKYGWWH